MADDARQSQPDLKGSDALPAVGIDFFQLLRRLEKGGLVFGRSGGPEREPARLGQQVRQNFAVQDVAYFQPASESGPAKVRVMNLGLLGPEGPMPLHLTRWVLDRLSQRWFSGETGGQTSDTTFVDFCDMLQHRMIALFYRAWADTRPDVQIGRNSGDRFGSILRALGGINLPGSESQPELDAIRTAQAAALGHQVHGPERLTRFVAAAVNAPVELVELVGNWLSIPANFQTRLGRAHSGLGTSAVAGARSFQRQNKIELRVGPLSLHQYKEFWPGGRKLQILGQAVLANIGHEIDADVRLILRKDAIPDARIGQAQLSRTAWLAPKREREADELRIGRVVGLGRDDTRAAA